MIGKVGCRVGTDSNSAMLGMCTAPLLLYYYFYDHCMGMSEPARSQNCSQAGAQAVDMLVELAKRL